VTWPDGHLGVLTGRPGSTLADLRAGPLAVMEALRQAPMWAHMGLRLTDWVIRHYTPAHVEHWRDLAEQRMT
jgi:hypothetical protein